MLNNDLIFNIFHNRLGNHAHVDISSDSSVTLLVTHLHFLSAIRKIDQNKHLLIFQRQYERTDDETAMLNQTIECMRECHLMASPPSIALLHPYQDDIVLFKLAKEYSHNN